MIVFAFGSVDTSDLDTDETSTAPKPTGVDTAAAPQPKVPKYHKMEETVSIGYTSYVVWRARWADRLSNNQFLDQPPDASYLFLDITVRNDDTKARTIPPFKLIDENGAEYEPSSKAFAVEGSIGPLQSLNPSVQKQGTIVFDVPKERKYKLKVSGGFWSAADALIEIVPK